MTVHILPFFVFAFERCILSFILRPYFISGIQWATFTNTISCFVCRKQGHQSKELVGDERGRGHGRSATWMIFVQRGKGESVPCHENYVGALIPDAVISSSLLAGGLWAVLSEAPAGRARGPSGRRGEGKHRHRDPGLQTALRWGHLHWWTGEQDFPTSIQCYPTLKSKTYSYGIL